MQKAVHTPNAPRCVSRKRARKNRWAERESNPHSRRAADLQSAELTTLLNLPVVETFIVRSRPPEDEEIVQAELKTLVPLEHETARREPIRGPPRLESMVFVHGHPREQTEACEDMHDPVDRRLRDREHQAPA